MALLVMFAFAHAACARFNAACGELVKTRGEQSTRRAVIRQAEPQGMKLHQRTDFLRLEQEIRSCSL